MNLAGTWLASNIEAKAVLQIYLNRMKIEESFRVLVAEKLRGGQNSGDPLFSPTSIQDSPHPPSPGVIHDFLDFLPERPPGKLPVRNGSVGGVVLVHYV